MDTGHHGLHEFVDGCYQRETGSFSGRFFDNGGSQLRNEIFPEYKAHRDATPGDKIAVPYIQALLEGDAYPYY
jgi:hypothetical protein